MWTGPSVTARPSSFPELFLLNLKNSPGRATPADSFSQTPYKDRRLRDIARDSTQLELGTRPGTATANTDGIRLSLPSQPKTLDSKNKSSAFQGMNGDTRIGFKHCFNLALQHYAGPATTRELVRIGKNSIENNPKAAIHKPLESQRAVSKASRPKKGIPTRARAAKDTIT